ncbi:MAG TPA: hypothetical protein VFC10_07315 [Terriglobia bacterium]|jgi:hypothetical protein|nr:hypothetical protein [Terracidiphilus sp.]HZT69542.1 hypothetical protein [Terriglobia bacterium]
MKTWQEAMEEIAQAMDREAAPDAIPLGEAVFCADCDVISRRTPTMRCLVCGSEATLDLAKVLNREEKEVGSRL